MLYAIFVTCYISVIVVRKSIDAVLTVFKHVYFFKKNIMLNVHEGVTDLLIMIYNHIYFV